MTKKKKALAKLTVSVVLAMILSISLALPAVAAEGPGGSIEGTEAHPAEAAITKVLELPVGTPTPQASFEFLVSPVEVDGCSERVDLDGMPVIGTNGRVTIDLSTGSQESISGGVKQVYKESISLFAGINWTHTGVYTYRITEVEDTYACSTSEPIEHMTYSPGEYKITVFVDRASDGTFYAKYIGTMVVVPGAPDQEGGDKVDPTPGGDPSVEGDYSQLIFTNNYYVINTPDNPDPTNDGVLRISKTVTGGALADHGQYFDFDITISNPETLIDPTRVYKAYVVDGRGVVSPIPAAQAPAGAINNDGLYDYIEFTTAALTRIQLKDGQSLSFVDLPIGSLFEAREVDPRNYTASLVLKVNNVIEESKTAGALGASLGLAKPAYVGEEENSLAFTNSYREVTPMGIAVDDLPYIIVAALALLSLAALITTKARRKTLGNR